MAVVLSCFVPISCMHSAAQQVKESQDSPSTIVVNVNAVLVPVVVRDQHGRAVGTLKKEDFLLFDKGKPQNISSFAVEKAKRPQNDYQVMRIATV